MKFLDEFKAFAMRGNVIDMAVGVVIGGAFGKIVTSLVNNIIMPPIGVLLGGMDFSDYFLPLSSKPVQSLPDATAQGIPVIAYGSFINTIIEFLIIAFSIFIVLKQINRILPKKEEAPAPRLCPFCKQPIADDATRCPHCTSQLEETAK